MSNEDELLPTFARPPLGEVAFIVQFNRLCDLRNLDLMDAWRSSDLRDRYPMVGEYAELPPFRERFGDLTVESVFLGRERPVARYNFRNDDRAEQVQIQRDRFAFYWQSKNPYPRFEQLLETFQTDYATFEAYARTAGWGNIVPNQCAISYSNLIRRGEDWNSLSDLKDVFTFLRADHSRALPRQVVPEAIHYLESFLIREGDNPVARLYVSCNQREDTEDAIDYELLVRGKPTSPSVNDVLQFFKMGRAKIVITFEALTTPSAHERWEKKT